MGEWDVRKRKEKKEQKGEDVVLCAWEGGWDLALTQQQACQQRQTRRLGPTAGPATLESGWAGERGGWGPTVGLATLRWRKSGLQLHHFKLSSGARVPNRTLARDRRQWTH